MASLWRDTHSIAVQIILALNEVNGGIIYLAAFRFLLVPPHSTYQMLSSLCSLIQTLIRCGECVHFCKLSVRQSQQCLSEFVFLGTYAQAE